MKRYIPILFLIVGLVFVNGHVRADSGGQLLMYGSKSCGLCNAMRNNLNAEKISYTFFDVREDPGKNREMWNKINKAHGALKSVRFPVMDLNGKILISPGFAEVKKELSLSAPSEPVKNETPSGGSKGIAGHGDIVVYGDGSSAAVKQLCLSMIDRGLNYRFINLRSSADARGRLGIRIKEQHPQARIILYPVVDVKGTILIAPSFEDVNKNFNGGSEGARKKPVMKIPERRHTAK